MARFLPLTGGPIGTEETMRAETIDVVMENQGIGGSLCFIKEPLRGEVCLVDESTGVMIGRNKGEMIGANN
jgi:hypothetical protein